jgi:hypothetical protein
MKIRAFAITIAAILLTSLAVKHAVKAPSSSAPSAPVAMHSTLPSQTIAKMLLNSTHRHREWVNVPVGSAGVRAFMVYPERSDNAPVVMVTANKQGASDWIRAVHGMGAVADVINAASCSDPKACPRIAKGFLQLMGAVGQFAETYQDANGKTDPAVAAAARQKVIEDLVTSMVDRTDREHGAVISVGGSLGLFGGQRYNDNGSLWAFPVRLTLGAGLPAWYAREVLAFAEEKAADDKKAADKK